MKEKKRHTKKERALLKVMVAPNTSVSIFAHAAFKYSGVRLAQVDDHEAIDHVGKFVETGSAPANN
jgi:hypothetical protein